MSTKARAAVAIAVFFTLLGTPQAVFAADTDAAYKDIRETYGSVPGFFYLFPDVHIAETWDAFRALQMNPEIAMDAKTRELVGVAVASQGTCKSCLYFHAAAAAANGASQAEISEAAKIGAATRRLDSAFEQSGAETTVFQRETDLILWGDPQTVDLRSPRLGLCRLVSESGNMDAGCN